MADNTAVLSNEPHQIYKPLPVLDYTASLYTQNSLNNTIVICVQHLAGSTHTLFRKMFTLGLDPSNLFVLGKCYSTNPLVFKNMQKENIQVCSLSTRYNSHSNYDATFRENVDIFFRKTMNYITKHHTNTKKIIVLDDGGFLITKASEHLLHNNIEYNWVGVEQTSAGFQRLNTEKPSMPVVCVARSRAKLKYESPFIADIVVDKVVEHIRKIKHPIDNVLVLGYGPIGQAVHKALIGNFDVDIFDVNIDNSELKSFPNCLSKYDAIIGCTGQKSISENNYKFLKRPVSLISASSSDREFDAVYLRQSHYVNTDCHAEIFTDGIYLLNSGFPVNFDDNYAKIDVKNLQLTRSLILAGIIQAANSTLSKPEILDLDQKYQNLIINNYLHTKYDQ